MMTKILEQISRLATEIFSLARDLLDPEKREKMYNLSRLKGSDKAFYIANDIIETAQSIRHIHLVRNTIRIKKENDDRIFKIKLASKDKVLAHIAAKEYKKAQSIYIKKMKSLDRKESSRWRVFDALHRRYKDALVKE